MNRYINRRNKMETELNALSIILIVTCLAALTALVLCAVTLVKIKKQNRALNDKLDSLQKSLSDKTEKTAAEQTKYLSESLSSLGDTVTRSVVNLSKK